MAVNKLHTIGRLTADPEMREINGIACVNFNLASDTRNRDAEGNPTTNFYRVTAWRKTAETMAKYLHKGDKVYIEGELVIRDYKDNNGNNRTAVGVTVSEFDFIQTKRNDSSDSSGTSKASKPSYQSAGNSSVKVDDDELPF